MWRITYKILVVVICKEELETTGPVGTTLQQTKHSFLTAHVAVPRVLFDGSVSRPLTNQEVHALHTETPAHRRYIDMITYRNVNVYIQIYIYNNLWIRGLGSAKMLEFANKLHKLIGFIIMYVVMYVINM